jgi:hypothetical protein
MARATFDLNSVGSGPPVASDGRPDMATAPSPDDTARAILRALISRLKLRGGQGALLGAVIQNAQAEGVDRRDFEAGLQRAIARGWILYDPDKQWLGLTGDGQSAGRTDAS